MKKINSPWDFSCPDYDQRSSCYIHVGQDYGVGKNQPVGTKGNPKHDPSELPMGSKQMDAERYNEKAKETYRS